MSIKAIYELVKDDLNAVNGEIQSQLGDELPFIDELSGHLIHSGGKRLRPLTLILSAKACGYEGDKHIPLATAMEFFHNATLLHDDVIDESTLRRGIATANKVWGAKASILVGDFLFTRSFQLIMQANSIPIIGILANVSNAITKGEVLQLLNCKNPKTTQEQYFEVIKYKTAVLFAAASELGGLLAECDPAVVEGIKAYGLHLGNAFQLVDDILDYSASSERMGKNVGDDLAEGKLTLPLIHVMQQGNNEQKNMVSDAITNANVEKLDQIIEAIEQTNALDYCYQQANHEIDQALSNLQVLPASDYKEGLETLAKFSLQREF